MVKIVKEDFLVFPRKSKLKPNIPNIIIRNDSNNKSFLGIDYNIPKDVPILPMLMIEEKDILTLFIKVLSQRIRKNLMTF